MISDKSTYKITSQVLTDAETATYNHTLMVTGRLAGEYECNVSNNKPSSSSGKIAVVGKIQLDLAMVRITTTQLAMLGEIAGEPLNHTHIHMHVLLIANPVVSSKFMVAAAPIQPACEPKIRSIDRLLLYHG